MIAYLVSKVCQQKNLLKYEKIEAPDAVTAVYRARAKELGLEGWLTAKLDEYEEIKYHEGYAICTCEGWFCPKALDYNLCVVKAS